MLWLHLIKITSKLLVMLAELFLGDNLIKFIIFSFIWSSLSSKHECHLLLDQTILTACHNVIDKIHIVHLLSNSQSIWILLLCLVNFICCGIRLDHLFSISCVLRARAEISAHSVVVSFITETIKFGEALSLHHEVHGFWLFVVVDKSWDDHIYKDD